MRTGLYGEIFGAYVVRDNNKKQKINKNTRNEIPLSIGIKNGNIPQKLYKYRPIDISEKNSRLTEIIANNQLWFASPDSFNDPFDCQIQFDLEITQEELCDFLKHKNLKSEPDPQKFAEALLANKSKFQDITQQFIQDFINTKGVCCFSKRWDILLQWAHYADKHTGIVLGFDLLKDTHFFANDLLDVSYVNKYPKCNIIKDQDKFAEILAGTKSKHWQYEEEYRVIKPSTENFEFIKEALTEVIFGIKTSDEDIISVKKLLMNNGYSNVTFYRAKLGEKEYRLNREKLS